MPKPIITFRPDLDADDNEVTIAVQNSVLDLPTSCGGLLRIKQLPSDQLVTEFYALSLNFLVHVDDANRPQGTLEAFLVHVDSGALLVINETVVDLVEYNWLHPGVNLLTKAFAAAKLKLQWTEAIEEEAEYLSHAAGQYGIREADVLQQALNRGRLGRRLTFKVRQLQKLMYKPLIPAAVIGKNIAQAREALGVSIEDVAAHAGLETERVLAFEGGLEVIFAEELVLLADALGIEDPEELLHAA